MTCRRGKIEGFPGYEIDTNGVVYSAPNSQHLKEITLKPQIRKSGYLYLGLIKDKKQQIRKIHRLIAQAFVPNPDNKAYVCHKDGNKLNNAIENLYWGTASENQLDALRHGTSYGPKSYGENHGNAKLNDKQVRVIKHILTIPRHISQRLIARIFKISPTVITNLLHEKSWKHVTI